jgi:hypothetical protein
MLVIRKAHDGRNASRFPEYRVVPGRCNDQLSSQG